MAFTGNCFHNRHAQQLLKLLAVYVEALLLRLIDHVQACDYRDAQLKDLRREHQGALEVTGIKAKNNQFRMLPQENLPGHHAVL